MATEERPVRILLHTEIFTKEDWVAEEIWIPRAQWNAMTPQERRRYLDEALDAHETDLVGSGWDLIGEDAGEEVA